MTLEILIDIILSNICGPGNMLMSNFDSEVVEFPNLILMTYYNIKFRDKFIYLHNAHMFIILAMNSLVDLPIDLLI